MGTANDSIIVNIIISIGYNSKAAWREGAIPLEPPPLDHTWRGKRGKKNSRRGKRLVISVETRNLYPHAQPPHFFKKRNITYIL